MNLLRFFTCGNVDDGKSTLIGRLLLDSGSISTDIIETLTRQSKVTGAQVGIDLALITDGLRAEREQGITIDVAYKFFSTAKRRFIVADTPGHVQYTRNMVTGASNTDLAIILIDVRHGITEQTQRHSVIAALLGLSEVVVCVNKMDMVGYDRATFEAICADYSAFADSIGIGGRTFIPVSALMGDNVVTPSANMPWYTGPTLLHHLETYAPPQPATALPARFDVQWVIRPQTDAFHDYRGLAGTLLSGRLSKGDCVTLYPSGIQTVIARIESNGHDTETLEAGMPGVLHTDMDVDAPRGTLIVPSDSPIRSERQFGAVLCWMSEQPYRPGERFLLRQNAFATRASIVSVDARLDIRDLSEQPFEGSLGLNDIVRITVRTADPFTYDPYRLHRSMGAFILVSEATNNTVAAGMAED